MIRNLKVLFAAAMVLGAVGAFSASGAQAAEFHCAQVNCVFTASPDGTVGTKASHHVYVVSNSEGASVALTCEQLTGSGTIAPKTSSLLTLNTGLAYHGCKDSAGNPVVVDFNGCDYTFTSGGLAGVTCPEGKKIQVTYGPEKKCTAEIGTFEDRATITYTTIGVTPNRHVTVAANVTNIPVSYPAGSTTANCLLDPSKTPITSAYTTGNTTVKATVGGVAQDGWWL
jgi:hypothetical protein